MRRSDGLTMKVDWQLKGRSKYDILLLICDQISGILAIAAQQVRSASVTKTVREMRSRAESQGRKSHAIVNGYTGVL